VKRPPSPSRARASARQCWLVVALSCAALGIASCGGGSAAPTAAAKAHAFALADSACREYDAFIEAQQAHEGTSSPSSELERFLERTKANVTRVRAAMSQVATLPRVGAYLADLAAQDKTLTVTSTQLKKGDEAYFALTQSPSFVAQAHRANAAVVADAKALGLSACTGPQPRKQASG
jgi:hypothetical protein